MSTSRLPTIHLLHGINVEQRGGNPRLLAPYLKEAGFTVKVRSYGKLRWWEARFANANLAACFADSMRKGDIVIAHSNGAALACLAADYGVQLGGVVCIQGALDADRQWAPQIPWVDVIANRGDGVLTASTLLFGHMWGALGRDGYNGPADSRITNIFTDERRPQLTPLLPEALGHSQFFTHDVLAAWGPWLTARIRRRLEGA